VKREGEREVSRGGGRGVPPGPKTHGTCGIRIRVIAEVVSRSHLKKLKNKKSHSKTEEVK